MSKPDDPTTYTTQAHEAACRDPNFDWENRQDFEFASRGLIHRPDDPAILDADGEVVWHHKAFEDFLHGEAPTTVHPSLWRHALLNNYRGLFKVTDGVYQVRGTSLANVTFVESDTGYVVIDPLTTAEVAAYSLKLLYDHVGQKPIVAVISRRLPTRCHAVGGFRCPVARVRRNGVFGKRTQLAGVWATTSPRISRSAARLLNALSIRLNGPKSVGYGFIVNWKITDSAESCHTELRNSVLVNRDEAHPGADTTVELTRSTLSQLVLGEIGLAELEQSGARILGDSAVLPNLLALLDHFPAWFPIATHGKKLGE